MTPGAIRSLEPRADGACDGFFVESDMSHYPVLHYSKKQVIRVGETLRGRLPEEPTEEVLQAFRIAYDWRNSHAYPMRKVRRELGREVRRLQAPGITAARLKRMSSIRKKLARLSASLIQIQDLGGCRAILKSMDDARALIAAYQAGASIHEIRKESDYIACPKDGGYRSHHIVVSFQGQDGKQIYDGRRIEIQIRTDLQHAWATAVEAVGLYRGEDLKAGEGNKDWLRLFALMSSEFAEIEKCPPIPDTPSPELRRKELRDLSHGLKAAETLEGLSQAFRAAESFIGTPHAKYFVLHYDRAEGVVTVRILAGAVWPANQTRDEQSSDDVLVEVDKIENLREAYPNYFGDVRVFLSHLKKAVYGFDTEWLATWAKRRAN